jgi:CHAT domain-containing protein/uncharacterized protein HemY
LVLGLLSADEKKKTPEEELAAQFVVVKTDQERDQILDTKKNLLNPQFINALNQEARSLRLQGKYAEAHSILKPSLRIAEQINDRKGMAQALMLMGTVYFFQRNYEEALNVSKQSLEIAEKDENKIGIADAFNNFGMIYADKGDYEMALDYHEKGLAIRNEIGDPQKITPALMSIARVYFSQGNFESSLKNYSRALELLEKTDDKATTASALNSIGALNDRLGNYSLSLEYLQKSLKLRESMGLKPGIASTLGNIGLNYYHQNNFDVALDYMKRSLSMHEELQDKRWMANQLNNIGDVYRAQSQYALALEVYEKSLKLREELSDKEGIGETANEMGKVYYIQNKRQLALRSFQRSLLVHEEMKDQEGMAQSLHSLSEVYLAEGNYAETLRFANRASELSKLAHVRDILWQAQTTAGKAHQHMNNLVEARKSFEEAITSIESLRTELTLSEEHKGIFFEDKLAPYHALVSLLVKQGQLESALSFSERAKSRVLVDALQTGKTNVNRVLTLEEQNQEQTLNLDLALHNAQIIREYQNEKPDLNRLKALNENLDKTRLNYEIFRANIYAAHPELRMHRADIQPISMKELVELVPDERTAFLEYVVTESKTFLFVLTRDKSINVREIDITQKDLTKLIQNFRNLLVNRDPGFREPAAELYRLLLDSVQTELANKNQLVITAEDSLWELPFQALQSENGSFFLEKYALRYVPSFTVLREMEKFRKKSSADLGALLAFGNPALQKVTVDRLKEVYRHQSLDPLPEAEKEVKTLGRLYANQRTKIYTGSEALEENFKSEAGGYRILHLATHGILNDATPMFSQIVLSQKGADLREDGLLEAREILNMNLNADLVVLSACESALGRVGHGEGMIGLSWAFFIAGSSNTIVSQWKVDSSSTTELMVAFHKNLHSGMSKSKALRNAAIKLMKSENYRHPYYWAPFVLIGDG